jgi:hypothetical protein
MGMDASHCRGRHLIPVGVDLIYGKLSLHVKELVVARQECTRFSLISRVTCIMQIDFNPLHVGGK